MKAYPLPVFTAPVAGGILDDGDLRLLRESLRLHERLMRERGMDARQQQRWIVGVADDAAGGVELARQLRARCAPFPAARWRKSRWPDRRQERKARR